MTSFNYSFGLTSCALRVANHEIFYAQATGLLSFDSIGETVPS